MLIGFALPQQAAAQNSVNFFGVTWTISDAEPVDEGGTARFEITYDPGPLRQLNISSLEYTFGSASLEDLGSDRPTNIDSSARRTHVLEVSIADDDIAEGEETFTVTLDFFPTLFPFSATGTINASDGGTSPPPVDATVSINDASVAKNGGNAEFTVSLTTAVDSDVTLAVAYAASTATLATDLGTRPGTVTIDRGQTEATLLVPISDDNIVEGDEDFTMTISEGATELPEGVIIGTAIVANDLQETTNTVPAALADLAVEIEERPAHTAGGAAVLADPPAMRLTYRGRLRDLLDRMASLSGYDWEWRGAVPGVPAALVFYRYWDGGQRAPGPAAAAEWILDARAHRTLRGVIESWAGQAGWSLDWNGPLETLAAELAGEAGYAFGVAGPQPARPVMVAIEADDMPVILVLRDAGIQTGLAVDPARRRVQLDWTKQREAGK